MLSVLAQGYKDWTPGQWGQAVVYVLAAIGSFLLVTLGPWLLKMTRDINEARRETSNARTQAALADQKADQANQSIKNTNDRAFNAALATPTQPIAVPVVLPVPTPVPTSEVMPTAIDKKPPNKP